MSDKKFIRGMWVTPRFLPVYPNSSRTVNDTFGLIEDKEPLLVSDAQDHRVEGQTLRFKGKPGHIYNAGFFLEAAPENAR